MRIAMWSGPRNLSTAMMYSFGARPDFSIMDEPFYAPWLVASGADHPMRETIIATHDSDPSHVAETCLAPIATRHLYMKHMPHHMTPEFPLEWASHCVNVHLIRHPARVIASYTAKRENPDFEEIGFRRQAELYDQIGGVVVDSSSVRENPQQALTVLCDAIGLRFDPAMLSWQAGPRQEDGIWAAHWYGAVHQSTGFAGAEGALPEPAGENARLCDRALPFYEKLKAVALI